jgi:beta-galactosidase/beta-glucuronidase
VPDGGDPPRQTARLRVDHPRLWSPESPALYRLTCTLSENGKTTDELCVPFGVRSIRFDPDHGFFLNGENRKLKGVCLHHDAGVLGAAVPGSVWAERLSRLKAAGCNAVRFSHNPADPKVLDLCDRLGLMVIEEAFDEWEGCKNNGGRGTSVPAPPLRLFGRLSAMARAGPGRHGAPRPQPSLHHPVEHRQRDRLPQRPYAIPRS